MQTVTVAAVQMVSGVNVTDNIARMRHWVEAAANAGAQWVVLPEYWPIMGQTDTDKIAHAEVWGQGPLQAAMQEAAQTHQVVLFGGTIPLKASRDDKVLNSMLVYDASGAVLGRYDKVHLFGFSGLGERYCEADTIEAGTVVPRLSVSDWRLAQGVCYDLRFPEFFRAQLPFDALVLPAAFTHTTGKAHWQTLLQARAIENQCYVIASAQGGLHENGRRTFGHSMIVNPWGEVVAVLPEGEGVVSATLDARTLNSMRGKLPALAHQIFKTIG